MKLYRTEVYEPIGIWYLHSSDKNFLGFLSDKNKKGYYCFRYRTEFIDGDTPGNAIPMRGKVSEMFGVIDGLIESIKDDFDNEVERYIRGVGESLNDYLSQFENKAWMDMEY